MGKQDIRKLLIIGLAASLIAVFLGELPIGWTLYPTVAGDETGMVGMLIGSGELSMLQLALGALFGGVFIPLHSIGFEATARIVENGGSEKAAKIIRAGAVATGFWGGIVHVICVALMFLCKVVDLSGVTGLTTIPQPVRDFALWLVMPICVVFMPVYYAMCIALFTSVVRGKTCLPRWAAVFNPVTGAVIMNVLPMLFPATELINALGMASMGIGSVITFGGLLAVWREK